MRLLYSSDLHAMRPAFELSARTLAERLYDAGSPAGDLLDELLLPEDFIVHERRPRWYLFGHVHSSYGRRGRNLPDHLISIGNPRTPLKRKEQGPSCASSSREPSAAYSGWIFTMFRTVTCSGFPCWRAYPSQGGQSWDRPPNSLRSFAHSL